MSHNRSNRKNISGVNGGFSFLPQIKDRTSEQFLQDIIKIQESQYTPINQVPTLLGRRIDLLAMYNAVAQRGGLKKMVTELSWQGVMKDLKIPLRCANACVALRSIYQRYLEQFERLQRNKATISDIEEELQIESENRYRNITQKSTLTHFNINPNNMVYRSDLHQISSHKRQEFGVSCDLSDVFEYRNLEMSLRSGLLNEIEFSLNTCLLMSYQNEGVQLWRNPKLLDLILSSVSISDSDLYCNQSLSNQSNRRFLRFWNNTITNENYRKFLDPDVFIKDNVKVTTLDSLSQIFTINEDLTIYDKEGQRIQLVATIIRNLAFDNSNGRFLTQSHQCIRFILLCCFASHFALRQLGLEIISMLKFPMYGILLDTFRNLLVDLTKSEDRVDRLRGLELISRLCDPTVCTENIEFFASLPKIFFNSLISSLIVHDLHLLVLALEVVYGLSEIDPIICNKLIECSSETLITLYTLLSLEAQVMGTKSLIRIRVMQGPSVIAVISSNIQNNIRPDSIAPQPNQKQLATSLMPPPPVPIHKVPISSIAVSHSTNLKPLTYAPANINMAIKSSTNQRTGSLNSKTNPSFSQPSGLISLTSISEITTLCQSNDLSVSITSSSKPIITSQYPILSQNSTISNTSNLMSTAYFAPVKSSVTNYATFMKTTCISTPLPSILLESAAKNESMDQSIKKPEPITSSTPVITSNKLPITGIAPINLPNNVKNISTTEVDQLVKETAIATSFVIKQEFVKSWLVSNYVEYPQCTVPLFLMYKQLQIAVQNHYKDSEVVTAEEFHKLVRLLFPQVQLVQLYTPGGTVEIHYYNLKSSPKTTILETVPEPPKPKLMQHNFHENNYCDTKNIVSHVNNAQTNSLVETTTVDQKSLKRHSNGIVNGFSSELSDTNHCVKKKQRFNDDSVMYNSSCQPNCQKVVALSNEMKENHLKNSQINGLLIPFSAQNESYNHVQQNQAISKKNNLSSSSEGTVNFNGSIKEKKDSESDIKTVLSTTVSPFHNENLTNGIGTKCTTSVYSNSGKIGTTTISNINQITDSNILTRPTSNSYSSESVISNQSSDDSLISDSNQMKKSFKRLNSNQLGRTRSRFRNNGSANKGKQRNYSNQRPYNLSHLYICEWDSCLQSFDKPQKVYGHVYTNHFMTLRTEVESLCLWAGCEDKTLRTPLPLLNHVNEQHCNNVALESARQIRLAQEKEKNVITSPETALSSYSENILLPKLVNINNNNNFPPKISSSGNDKSVSSVSTYQLATQPPISQLSNVQVSQTAAVSTSNPISVKESTSISISEPHITTSQVLPTSITLNNSTKKEIIIPSSSSIKTEQIVESNSNFQNHSKSSSSNICSSIGVSNSNDSGNTSESFQSIKRSAKEGPVTKHIRFLSALILRNLCQNSSVARRFVSARHQQIFEMSISGCESSTVLCECLLFSSDENCR